MYERIERPCGECLWYGADGCTKWCDPVTLDKAREIVREAMDDPSVEATPHGRLGDLDALEEKARERSGKIGEFVNVMDKVISAYDISTAPTIIPAEEGIE